MLGVTSGGGADWPWKIGAGLGGRVTDHDPHTSSKQSTRLGPITFM